MKRTIIVKDQTLKNSKKNDSNLIEKLNSNFNKNKTANDSSSNQIEDERAQIINNDNDIKSSFTDVDNGPSADEVREYVINRRRNIKESQENITDDTIVSRTAVAQNEIDDNDIKASQKYVETVLQPIKKELYDLKKAYDEKMKEAWKNVSSPVSQNKGYAIASTNDGNLGSDYSKSNYEFVNHPSHYNNTSIETIEKMRRIWGNEQTAIWCEMTAFKYRDRIGNKPDNSNDQEVGKIKWYEDKAKELRSLEN